MGVRDDTSYPMLSSRPLLRRRQKSKELRANFSYRKTLGPAARADNSEREVKSWTQNIPARGGGWIG